MSGRQGSARVGEARQEAPARAKSLLASRSQQQRHSPFLFRRKLKEQKRQEKLEQKRKEKARKEAAAREEAAAAAATPEGGPRAARDERHVCFAGLTHPPLLFFRPAAKLHAAMAAVMKALPRQGEAVRVVAGDACPTAARTWRQQR